MAPLVERATEACRHCLADARLGPGQIDDVLLLGGQSRAPQVIDASAQRVFDRPPRRAASMDERVAMGAAIQAGIVRGELEDVVLVDVTPHTLGIETRDGTFTPLIERNSRIPTRKTRVFTTIPDNQTRVSCTCCRARATWPRTTRACRSSSCSRSRGRRAAYRRSRSASRST